MNKQIGYLSVEKIMFQSPAQNIAQPLGTSNKNNHSIKDKEIKVWDNLEIFQ